MSQITAINNDKDPIRNLLFLHSRINRSRIETDHDRKHLVQNREQELSQ